MEKVMEKMSRRMFCKVALAAGSVALLGTAGCAAPSGSREGASGAAGAAGAAGASGSAADDARGDAAGTQDGAGTGASSAPEAGDAAATGAQSPGAGSAAVVFFSCTGNTRAVAEKIAQGAGAPLLEIVPQEPYTAADLNYNADCRANAEQNGDVEPPALAQPIPDVAAFDTVFLGYPIWWGRAPRAVLAFVEAAGLAGKAVVPFCTSGGSGIEGSLAELEAAAPDADWRPGRRFNAGVSQSDVDAWLADAS